MDAKGQDTVYTYDSLKRVTMVQRYLQREEQRRGHLRAGDVFLRLAVDNPNSPTFFAVQHHRAADSGAVPGVCREREREHGGDRNVFVLSIRRGR